jgi:hypothetical protein
LVPSAATMSAKRAWSRAKITASSFHGQPPNCVRR